MLQIILEDLIKRYPALETLKDKISDAGQALISCYENKGKVLVCGNGGSSSDSDHIVGELMKGFEHKRPIDEQFKNKLLEIDRERGRFLSEKLQIGLPAISLTAQTALITAVANDNDASVIFAQQVVGYGNGGDILIAISSSGNSQNVLDAILVAKAKGLKVIGLTGESGGKMNGLCDVLINVPGKRTASVQELHLPVYHALCVMVESHFFGNYYLDLKHSK
jgi:D-sedoheptulose 7-phosphate isomerase